jgi:outer membrane biosynthesis protein TonB
MREESWYKWFFVAMLIHALILVTFSVSIKTSPRRIDIPYYSVNLVGDVGEGASEPKAAISAPPAKPAEPAKPKAVPPKAKEQVVSTSKERTLKPVIKKDVPESPTKDDVRRLNERIRQMSQNESTEEKIRQMQQHVQYMDITAKGKRGGSGSKGGSASGGSAYDVYSSEVRERIMEAWSPPPSAKTDLLTVVTIKIRKEGGRIADWQIEQRSGNRIYDEAVSRTLRSVTDLPPIPSSLNTDVFEIGLNFMPVPNK